MEINHDQKYGMAILEALFLKSSEEFTISGGDLLATVASIIMTDVAGNKWMEWAQYSGWVHFVPQWAGL